MARRQIGSNDAAERALHSFQTILATGAEQPSIELTKGVYMPSKFILSLLSCRVVGQRIRPNVTFNFFAAERPMIEGDFNGFLSAAARDGVDQQVMMMRGLFNARTVLRCHSTIKALRHAGVINQQASHRGDEIGIGRHHY